MSPKRFNTTNIPAQNNIPNNSTVEHKAPTTEPIHRQAKVVSRTKSNHIGTYEIKQSNLCNPKKKRYQIKG